MTKHTRGGMTIIELLTVIAIISMLAAILLPVLGTVRESARQATCLSNMQKIYVAVSQYRQDNGDQFPPLLLGPAEDASGLPAVAGSEPVPISRMQRAFLYPKYINDITVFRCPDNLSQDPLARTVAAYGPNEADATFATMGLPWTDPSAFVPYYAFDSYDTTVLPTDSALRQVTYTRDWTGVISTDDPPNQMKYRNAPPDKTVVTWCNYHARVAGAPVSPMLLASGTAKAVPAKDIAQRGWRFVSGN